jgi:hypothetical protein
MSVAHTSAAPESLNARTSNTSSSLAAIAGALIVALVSGIRIVQLATRTARPQTIADGNSPLTTAR